MITFSFIQGLIMICRLYYKKKTRGGKMSSLFTKYSQLKTLTKGIIQNSNAHNTTFQYWT